MPQPGALPPVSGVRTGRPGRPGRILGAAIFGLVGVAILLWMGVWQVDRLAWKNDLVARIEARLAAEPVAPPEAPDPDRDALLRVTVTGRIGEQELHVLSSLKPLGVGYRIVSPMVLDDGRRVMVDLGFVPEAMKDPAERPPAGSGRPGEVETVTGLLRWPQETDSFTPEPDLGRNIWFARDVEAMAQALDTAPVLIVVQAHERGEWPRPVPPGTDLPNRHLEYAITWFGLAVVWVVMTILWIRTEILGRPQSRL